MVAAILTGLSLFVTLLAWKGRRTLHERLYPEFYNSPDFPENRFPAQDRHSFLVKTALGYEKIKNSTIIICGIARDDAETLPLTIRRIEKTGELFAGYRVVIFENDSTDQTPLLLRNWAADNPRVTILSESIRNLSVSAQSRFARLAWCRNRYLEHLDRSPELCGYDYLMVVDMDLGGGWSYDGIASTFAENNWDAVASNSIGYHNLRRTYYDTLALKPPTVLKQTWLLRLIGEGWQLHRSDPLLPVESAFGGLCLYRRTALHNRRYNGTAEGRDACEHHALNTDGSLRFFLNPAQITITGTQEQKGYGTTPRWIRAFSRTVLNW